MIKDDGQNVTAYITREDLDCLQLRAAQKVYIKPRKLWLLRVLLNLEIGIPRFVIRDCRSIWRMVGYSLIQKIPQSINSITFELFRNK